MPITVSSNPSSSFSSWGDSPEPQCEEQLSKPLHRNGWLSQGAYDDEKIVSEIIKWREARNKDPYNQAIIDEENHPAKNPNWRAALKKDVRFSQSEKPLRSQSSESLNWRKGLRKKEDAKPKSVKALSGAESRNWRAGPRQEEDAKPKSVKALSGAESRNWRAGPRQEDAKLKPPKALGASPKKAMKHHVVPAGPLTQEHTSGSWPAAKSDQNSQWSWSVFPPPPLAQRKNTIRILTLIEPV